MFAKWVGWETDDLDALRANAEKAKSLGLDGIAFRLFLTEPMLSQIEFPDDTYTQYTIHNPSIFKFVEAGVFTGIYPADQVKRNFDLLVRKCRVVGDAGLGVKLAVMEPQFMSREFYARYPHLKGPRVDHPSRSKHEYYAPCIDREEVLAAYREGTKKLCSACPAIVSISVFTNDSGAGICWCQNLYPGRNGPEWCKDISVGERVGKFIGTILDGARDAGGGEVTVTLEPHGWPRSEVIEASEAMPEGGGLYFPTRSIKEGRPAGRGRWVPSKDGATVVPVEYKWEGGVDFGPHPPPLPFFILEMLGRIEERKASSAWIELGLPDRENERLDINAEIWQAVRERIPRTEPERLRALEKILAEKGLAECAGALLSAWREADHAIKTWPRAGMGLTYYGSMQNARWLTRPIVPVPVRLTADETDYFLNYIMCAGGREVALLFDQDGPGKRSVYSWQDRRHLTVVLEIAILHAEDGIAILEKEAAARPEGSFEQQCLNDQRDRILYLACFMKTQKNAIQAQGLIDKYTAQYRDEYHSLKVLDRGAFLKIIDDEMDNTSEWVRLLERHPEYIPTVPAAEASMYAFGDDLVEQLQKKRSIMERHRSDVDELFEGWAGNGTEYADGVLPTSW